MKQETAQPPAVNRGEQQRVMDRFQEEYNQVRPHEALGMRTPAALYQPSWREFPARIAEPEYPETMLVRSVRSQGQIRWKKQEVFLSEVLWGERVGLLPVDDRWFKVYFAQVPLALFDSQRLCTKPLSNAEDLRNDEAGEGNASPSPAPHPRTTSNEVSGMCPV